MRNFDYIIVGGGAAGCIIAKRISERSETQVLLIEAGKSDEGDSSAMDLSKLDDQDDSYDWGYFAKATSQSSANMAYSRAKLLGGCANHNDCAFLQAPDSDFNDWPAQWQADNNRAAFERINQRLHIESSPTGNVLSRAFIDANIENGVSELNFRETVSVGTGWFPLNVLGSLRQSSSIAYLHPLEKLPANLTVMTETIVEQILFSSNRAIGVQTNLGKIFCNNELILSAGSINTPQLLMLSGIGNTPDLHKAGVTAFHHLPAVGQNLMDHVASNIVYELHQPAPQWQLTPCEATALIQIDAEAPAPDVLFHAVLRLREKWPGMNTFDGIEHGIKLSPNVARPHSRGHLKLVSARSEDPLQINLNYFSDDQGYDIRILREGLRYARELSQTNALMPWIKREVFPGKDIVTDQDMEIYLMANCETVYHPCGSCKMGEELDPTSVVTPDLKVMGIDGLRIADASVFPVIPTVNICNTVMMIAERAADMITNQSGFS